MNSNHRMNKLSEQKYKPSPSRLLLLLFLLLLLQHHHRQHHHGNQLTVCMRVTACLCLDFCWFAWGRMAWLVSIRSRPIFKFKMLLICFDVVALFYTFTCLFLAEEVRCAYAARPHRTPRPTTRPSTKKRQHRRSTSREGPSTHT